MYIKARGYADILRYRVNKAGRVGLHSECVTSTTYIEIIERNSGVQMGEANVRHVNLRPETDKAPFHVYSVCVWAVIHLKLPI